jgi:pyruvate/2-oxoglutarate dehydrogenase complex dihydrolipoamide dehydrogenase (E3) component
VAIREGAAFAQTEFYDNPTSFDHEMVASAIFTQPQIGLGGPVGGRRPAQVRQGRHLLGEVPADEGDLLRRVISGR